jgi:hypothetical protein
MRRLRRPAEDEEREALAPSRAPPEHSLLELQRGAGNAAVTRLLARQPVADPFDKPKDAEAQPAVEPHAEGVPNVVPGQAPPDVATWAAQSPVTNPELATWILAGETHGFVTLYNDSRTQLETFEAGNKYAMKGGGGGTVDGSATAGVMPMLESIHGIVSERAKRWVADPKTAKQPLSLNSLARNLSGGDAHSTGAALDAGGFDFTKPSAAKHVVQILKDLPVAGYKIGLPYQGPFFSVFDSLMSLQNKAVKDAGEGGTPADVTTAGLVEWESVLSTATWKDGAWVPKRVWSASARSKLQDADLRAKLGGFDGKTFEVFPDRPNHIHIQRKLRSARVNCFL